MSEEPFNVLVLCTGNSARSIMAEALFNVLGRGRYQAYSAGSHPTGRVNPFAIEQIAALNYPIEQLRSKSWDEFESAEAPVMDLVITVCDNAAGEVCPIWPGAPLCAHWGFADPAAASGSDEDKRREFARIYDQIATRVRAFVDLPADQLDRAALQDAVRAIGQSKID